MKNLEKEIGFVLCDLVNRCSNDLTEIDLQKIIPILKYLEENKNFEASFLLANYFDPGGCIFNNVIEDVPEKYDIAMRHYAKAAQNAKNGKSDREESVFNFCSELPVEYERVSGKHFEI